MRPIIRAPRRQALTLRDPNFDIDNDIDDENDNDKIENGAFERRENNTQKE